MISVKEALLKVKENTTNLDVQTVEVENAVGYSLSEDIFSQINMPPFDQSAMDGYAVQLHNSDSYSLIGEVKAGDNSEFTVNKGEAVRIFTGAMIPAGANTVIKQEDINRNEGEIVVQNTIKLGDNIRYAGEQIKKGQLALEKNSRLNPGAIGFLSMLGFTKISVYRKPIIGIIATGNELVKPGNPLEPGSIYESNTFMLNAAINEIGLEAKMHTVEDNYEATRDKINKVIEESDLTIITGGISVGDYDFVGDALNELEVESHFYKVRQKPGKPLFFGTRASKNVFALPGNPAAVLSCFYVYVLPCIKLLMGRSDYIEKPQKLSLTSPYKKTAKMTHFLKAYAEGGEVTILKSQSSAMLNSFTKANCLVKMSQDREEWQIGDKVSAILI